MRDTNRPTSKNITVLKKTLTYLKPYKFQIFLSGFALLFTAGVTLSLGQGLRHLIDSGFSAHSKEQLAYSLFAIVVIGVLLAIQAVDF